MIELHGTSLIGRSTVTAGHELFHAVNPATGEKLEPAIVSAAPADVEKAAALAGMAFESYSHLSGGNKGNLLRRIADEIERSSEPIIHRANLETALPRARLQSELARTCFQLRLFAEVVEEGSWVDARIDHGDPSRQPLPKPDVRSMMRPVGPVAVFGSSNFPLAFSVAGGDTASALAAGCPVIVKAHPAHPGTSELAGGCIQRAVADMNLPEGVFSLLFDSGYDVGIHLVQDPRIKAVGFTGSRLGGHALMKAAESRPERIPVYAEMGSVNPVFLFHHALKEKGDQIVTGLHASVTLGVGQFCTNPGLVFVQDGDAAGDVVQALKQRMDNTPEGTMLTSAIAESYRTGVEALGSTRGIEGPPPAETSGAQALSAVFVTDVKTFLSNPSLSKEIFGPVTLVVLCRQGGDFASVARSLEGQLTATIHATDEDAEAAGELVRILETRVGRIVFNGFPTGVEVGHAMVHGGPYPATSDGRSTSVGTRAIRRFARAVCWQNAGERLLPDELKDSNPFHIHRLVDGNWV